MYPHYPIAKSIVSVGCAIRIRRHTIAGPVRRGLRDAAESADDWIWRFVCWVDDRQSELRPVVDVEMAISAGSPTRLNFVSTSFVDAMSHTYPIPPKVLMGSP